MNEELESQDKQLADLQDHAEKTLNDINEVEATTRRDFKLREDAGQLPSPCPHIPAGTVTRQESSQSQAGRQLRCPT